jgi:hypothetical protein
VGLTVVAGRLVLDVQGDGPWPLALVIGWAAFFLQ